MLCNRRRKNLSVTRDYVTDTCSKYSNVFGQTHFGLDMNESRVEPIGGAISDGETPQTATDGCSRPARGGILPKVCRPVINRWPRVSSCIWAVATVAIAHEKHDPLTVNQFEGQQTPRVPASRTKMKVHPRHWPLQKDVSVSAIGNSNPMLQLQRVSSEERDRRRRNPELLHQIVYLKHPVDQPPEELQTAHDGLR